MTATTPTRRQIEVCIGKAGLPVGSLVYVRQGRREHSTFAYDSSWLDSPARFNVSADLQLMPGYQPHKARSLNDSVFHGAIADTAPDAWGRRVIARAHAKRRKTDPQLPALTELDYLLAVDDFSRVGALRLRDADGDWHRTTPEGRRSTPPLIELQRIYQASRAVERGQETAEDLRYLQGKGTSLGGMRPKCTLVDKDGRLAIGKFPSVGDTRSVTRGEVLALKLAARAGIEAAPARVVLLGDEGKEVPVAVICRFDRDGADGRIPYQSAASLLQASREEDRSYTEIADAIRTRLRHQPFPGQRQGIQDLAVGAGRTDHRRAHAAGPRALLRIEQGTGLVGVARGLCGGLSVEAGRAEPRGRTAGRRAGRFRAGFRARRDGSDGRAPQGLDAGLRLLLTQRRRAAPILVSNCWLLPDLALMMRDVPGLFGSSGGAQALACYIMSEHSRPASTGPANRADDTCGQCDCGTAPLAGDIHQSASNGDIRLHIPRMDCAVEEQEIRALLADIEGIRRLSFRLAERTLTLDANEDAVDRVTRRLREAGFPNEQLTATPDAPPALTGSLRKPLLALGCALAAELVHLLLPDSRAFSVLGMGLAALAIALAGLGTYRNGLRALRAGKLNMNALMGIAVTGAFLIGQWPEAAMVMALYALAELIEARSVDRARDAVRTLLDLAPAQAAVEQPDGSWLNTPVAAVTPGARVRVRPGSRISVDGVIEAGHSAVNQSPVTGESLPVDKTTGDTVFAGTINETGLLDIRVTRAARDTTLARIIHAVEQAQASRAPTQRFVDRFAAIYTPLVFAGALAVALLAPFVLGMAWMEAIYTALVLLVIACPCALVLSTPVTIVSGLASAARKGVLIKGGSHLEAARRLRAVALDKTGTLTEGRPRLVDHDVMPDVNAGDALNRAALLAGHSDHPVSQAIAAGLPATATEVATEAATETADDSAAERFTALPGRGVSATIGGREWVLGNHRLIEERGLCSPALEQRLHAHEAQGHTVTLLADDERVHALFAVADRLRPHSAEAVAALKSMGVAPVMLSGDNADTARTIAAEAGIEDARGDLLPEDKLAAIDALRSRYGACAMVGDGINDAPALARADIGIAMGGAGTDTAIEAADIVIMNDDLRRIPDVIRLSRRTHAVLWQNIALAIGIKAVFMVLALRGDASMWMAVFADMGASLIVVANGLRLSRH